MESKNLKPYERNIAFEWYCQRRDKNDTSWVRTKSWTWFKRPDPTFAYIPLGSLRPMTF